MSQSKKINRGGMGFGLTISKMIIQQLNGEISVDSKLNTGSVFTFQIRIEDTDLINQVSRPVLTHNETL